MQAPAGANTATVISGTPSGSAAIGQAYNFLPVASDADADPLRFYIINQPAWTTFDSATGRLSGTPASGNVGAFPAIRISVSDGKSIADLPVFSITVKAPNRAPVLSGTPATSVQAGSPYSFQPVASDPDGDRLTFTIRNKPSWASFSSTTGSLTGTPGASHVGLYSGVTISVSDGSTSVALASFAIDVTGSVSTDAQAAYSFDAGSGTVAADVTGRGNTVNLVNGVAWTAGKFGSALSFDGSNDYGVGAAYKPELNLQSGFTLSAWIYPKSNAAYQMIVNKPAGATHTAPYFDWSMHRQATTGKLVAFLGCDGAQRTSNAATPLNTWTHVAVTYDGTTLRHYINGVLDNSQALSCVVPNTSSRPIRIGANGGGTEVMNGLIDDVRIHARPLAIAEIQNDMKTALGSGGAPAPTPDTTLPTVSMTAPASGATVSGTVTVSATASDNVGVVGVQFRLNGVNLGAEDLTAPYSVSWNTTASTNETHTLTAVARDAAGNQGMAMGVTVTVNNVTAPTNRAPVISGTPSTSVTAGNAYAFQPSAADADGDALTFSITNKPAWATFSTTNGRLSGTPSASDVGTYSGISIRASDGKTSTALASFAITVNQVATGNATVTWTPPTTNTDGSALTNLTGYRLYYGTSATNLTQTIEINNAGATAYVVEGLSSGKWYFALKAYSSAGGESVNSNVVSKTVP